MAGNEDLVRSESGGEPRRTRRTRAAPGGQGHPAPPPRACPAPRRPAPARGPRTPASAGALLGRLRAPFPLRIYLLTWLGLCCFSYFLSLFPLMGSNRMYFHAFKKYMTVCSEDYRGVATYRCRPTVRSRSERFLQIIFSIMHHSCVFNPLGIDCFRFSGNEGPTCFPPPRPHADIIGPKGTPCVEVSHQ